MKKVLIALLIISLMSFYSTDDPIIGQWKLISYDAIENIKQNPAYQYADDHTRSQIDKQFEEILSKGKYIFTKDTLRYSDLEGTEIVNRRAIWTRKADELIISEIDRPFKRKAYIRKVSVDSLILSPILEDEISESRMRFVRYKNGAE